MKKNSRMNLQYVLIIVVLVAAFAVCVFLFEMSVKGIRAAGDDSGAIRQQTVTYVFLLGVAFLAIILMIIDLIRKYRTAIIQLATTDELTGLNNRKSFIQRYQELEETGGLHDSLLFMMDVDFFKQVNDTCGHAAGDSVLSGIAAKILALGDQCLAARWGGDEYIGVLINGKENAVFQLENLIREIAEETFPGDVHVTVSVGAALITEDLDLTAMSERADYVLYQSKKGGRGRLTVYDPETMTVEGTASTEKKAPKADRMYARQQALVTFSETKEERQQEEKTGKTLMLFQILNVFLGAVNYMLPFAIGGGILIAIAFLLDGVAVDVNSLTADQRSLFGTITPIAAVFKGIGDRTFAFMLPVVSAFLAETMGGPEAFVSGFVGGYMASTGSSGFAGAVLAGLLAGWTVRLMKNFFREIPRHVASSISVLLYPVVSLLIMNVLMVYLIEPGAGLFNHILTAMLEHMSGFGIILGAVVGMMMATDMGGPVNKAAYYFGTASIASGHPEIMAAVMIGGMVPPCGIALATWMFPQKFTEAERKRAPVTLLLGLSFITEGAIPYVLEDMIHVIPACMCGSALAGLLSEAFACTSLAPHGGFFVFPVVEKPIPYFVSLFLGSLLCALVLGGFRKRKAMPEKGI